MYTFVRGVLGGILIGIGCGVFLSLYNTCLPLGSVLFSFGLLTILALNYKLYTGAIGFYRLKFSELDLLQIYSGNLIGTALIGLGIRFFGTVKLLAGEQALIASKENLLLNLPVPEILFAGIMCGILMFLAVYGFTYVTNEIVKVLMVIFPVSIFILSGYEHCIADMIYLFASVDNNIPVLNKIIFILLVTLGNSIGSIVFCLLMRVKQNI